jgi:hypothetical protein
MKMRRRRRKERLQAIRGLFTFDRTLDPEAVAL